MANLSANQKKEIKELKIKISNKILTIAKIQEISPIEHNLLKQAMDYAVTDRIGDYDGRVMELHKYQYMIDGILYNHLDSKQIKFGTPKYVEIPKPASIDTYEESINYVPPEPEYDINEEAF